jgi:hypothetical protein
MCLQGSFALFMSDPTTVIFCFLQTYSCRVSMRSVLLKN